MESLQSSEQNNSVKILGFQADNFKGLKAVYFEPKREGLTVIGGDNGAGKSSALHAIAYAIGGEKRRPSNPKRQGAVGDTLIHVDFSNGVTVERKGKNLSLYVTDRTGSKQGQALLDAFVSNIAIDLPKFYNASAKDKSHILLETLGLEAQLADLARREKEKYDTRTSVKREADRKQKAAEALPWHEDAPQKPVSVAELIKTQQAILARNGLRAEHKRDLAVFETELESIDRQLADLTRRKQELAGKIMDARRDVANDGEAESTAELEAQIASFEEINRKVAENAERERRLQESDALSDQADTLTVEIEAIRKERLDLLKNAAFPLPGLAIGDDNELVYQGQPWDCMSGAQQLIVSCAIASKLNPACRFVLMDKLEQLDLKTLAEFDAWLKTQDLQCIATRVSTGSECTLVIEDGTVKGDAKPTIIAPAPQPKPTLAPRSALAPLSDSDY